MLAAARDGCASCVEHWLEKGVDPNFESSSSQYTAVDFVLWAKKKAHISEASAKQVVDILVAAGGKKSYPISSSMLAYMKSLEVASV